MKCFSTIVGIEDDHCVVINSKIPDEVKDSASRDIEFPDKITTWLCLVCLLNCSTVKRGMYRWIESTAKNGIACFFLAFNERFGFLIKERIGVREVVPW